MSEIFVVFFFFFFFIYFLLTTLFVPTFVNTVAVRVERRREVCNGAVTVGRCWLRSRDPMGASFRPRSRPKGGLRNSMDHLAVTPWEM